MTTQTLILNTCFGAWTFLAKIIVFLFYPLIKKFMLWRMGVYKMDINGPKPTDIQILSDDFYSRYGVYFSLGFGEAYLDGLWTARDLPGALKEIFRRGIINETVHPPNFLFGWLNLQTKGFDSKIVAEHYNFGNDWYEALLGPSMQYTCAYWKTATNLEDAQFDKMELVAQKLKLKPGMRVLDFECGWATLAIHLAKNYGVSVVCITNSIEQSNYIRTTTMEYPIEIRVCDYRDMKEIATFDRVTSIGCVEHFGINNLTTYFKIVRNCLKEDGLALVQIVLRNKDQMKYGNIFPNVWAPSHLEFTKRVEGILRIEDWATHGQYYAMTLKEWRNNFHNAWPHFEGRYGERVFRMWDYYFALGIALFEEHRLTLSQIVLSKNGIQGGYECLR